MVMECGGSKFDKVPAIIPAMFRVMSLVGTLVWMLVCHVLLMYMLVVIEGVVLD